MSDLFVKHALETFFCILCPALLTAMLIFFCSAWTWRNIAQFWRRQYDAKALNCYRDHRTDLTPCIRRAGVKNGRKG